MQDIQATLRQELDFVHEGHNGERCADELKHLSYVYVPKIHWDLTTKVRVVYQSLLSRKTNNSLGLQQHSVIECSLPARNVRFQQFGGGCFSKFTRNGCCTLFPVAVSSAVFAT